MKGLNCVVISPFANKYIGITLKLMKLVGVNVKVIFIKNISI